MYSLPFKSLDTCFIFFIIFELLVLSLDPTLVVSFSLLIFKVLLSFIILKKPISRIIEKKKIKKF